jgi:DNA polymerase (family X)
MAKSINREIAEIFNSMGDILEIEDVQWKPRAYHAAARSLEVLGEDVRDIYKKGGLKGLEDIPGIGEGLGKKIVEFIKRGKIPEYEKLKKTLPAGMGDLMSVPGLGPYRVENLYHHGIHSPADLKAAVLEHKVAGIPGFGSKSEEKIGESLGLKKPHQDRRPREEVLPSANRILLSLKGLKTVKRLELVGSLRRKEESIGDIDILAVSNKPGEVMETFTALPFIQKVILHGAKKSEVLLENGLQVDFRVFEPESFGAAMIYFTGNKQHNIELRKIAIRKGWKLNEYGLFDKAGNRLAGATEEEVYRKLGFKFIPPEKRKNEGELESYGLS